MSVAAIALTAGTAQAGDVKIGFLLKTMQEERYKRDRAAFTAKAEELGAEVIFDSANNDELTQLAKFENMLAKGATVIVLQPVNTGTAGSMVSMANSEGVRVVGYDSMLVDGPLDAMVMQDSWAVGRLQGEAMVDWLKDKNGDVTGKIALIQGQPGDSNAIAMSSGVLEIVEANPGLELVTNQAHEGWSSEKAMATAENTLTSNSNGIDAFIANNSGMARGVIAALEAQGLASADKVFVAGSDADLANIQYVAQGKQAVEIWKQIDPLAETAAAVAVALANAPDGDPADLVKVDKVINNGYADVPTIVTPITLVTQDNIDDTIIAGGFYSKEEVYGN
ncbi:substrate-binding domain-containing protein [Ruegeria sp. 2205SS24-7]|uniref:substrate-binding domain-containing protein n=1 Tax=Ruegeria discodermiae TaxID=3064389 RepID=UPI002740E360|nr:substrate-binding domain-containing protein [Ruegeria sp. 2205SS24-7]MDP5220224.1 substrate-binding domain-containing protein [Ruegeria sp. 2205SS24-7]